jgi:hypothetical protein
MKHKPHFQRSTPAQAVLADFTRITRRGCQIGWLQERCQPEMPGENAIKQRWQQARPILLPGLLEQRLSDVRNEIQQTENLVEHVLDGIELATLLAGPPYGERLGDRFELVSAVVTENDDQEIEKLLFNAWQNDRLTAEDLWLKAAWLSFYDEDASLRFRFSFGMENYEDVAADLPRERLAAQLCDCIFPESRIMTANPELSQLLRKTLDIATPEFIERIVYFNGPEGGAQFHHDVERGHLGVAYAQLTGRTVWLALSTDDLLREISEFTGSPETEREFNTADGKIVLETLKSYLHEDEDLKKRLHDADNEALEILLNRTPAFFSQLVTRGHAYTVRPGDVLLLPQHGLDCCAWHTVFCAGDELGEALSFAIRESTAEPIA